MQIEISDLIKIQENPVLFYIVLTRLSVGHCDLGNNSFLGPKSELTSGVQKYYVIAINLCF